MPVLPGEVKAEYGGNYTLRIILREESPTALWLDVVATAGEQ